MTSQLSVAANERAINWDDLNWERSYHGRGAYSQSKIAFGLFGLELDRRSRGAGWGITSNICHPGIAPTNLLAARPEIGRPRDTGGVRLVRALSRLGISGTVDGAALPALYAATSPDARGCGGRSTLICLVPSMLVSWSTFASLALALVTVAAAFGAVLATRPAARRLAAAWPSQRVPSWWRDRVSASVLVLVAGAAVALALVAVFVEILDAVVDKDDLAVIDRPAVAWLAQHRPRWSSGFVVALTDIGGKLLLTGLLAVTASVVAFRLRSWRPLVLAAVSGVGGVLLVASIKALIARDRPDPLHRAIAEDGFSFPSGHSASAVVVLATVAWLVSMVTRRRTVRATAWVAAAVLAVAVGLSRVYLGVHYPSDVLGGWILGATWLSTVVVAAHLPDSPLLPFVRRWRGAEREPGPVARRPTAVFAVAAAAGLAGILGAVSLSTIGD